MTHETMIHEDCGGTIYSGGLGSDEEAHDVCDRCGAYRYDADDDDTFPSGRGRARNQAAWDDGDERSPEEEEQ